MTSKYLVIAVVLIAAIVRFIGLSSPGEVVFDEVHFGKFVTSYCCTEERFFDIHPPHGKLLIAGAVAATGYQGGFGFVNIGDTYPESVPLLAFRMVPALMGTLLVLIVMVLIRQLGGSDMVAVAGGVLLAFDNALVVQSRLVSLDMILLTTTFLAISLYLAGEARVEKKISILLFTGAGLSAGIALGTKFTGLAALASLGVFVFIKLWQVRKQTELLRRWITIGTVILTSAIVVYLLGWVLHWGLLTLPGPGDAFHIPDFSSGPLSFFSETIEHHRIMLSANFNLTAEHPYASLWWQWPLLIRPVFYWQGASAFIYLIGNPIVWWGSTVVFITALIGRTIAFGRRRSSPSTARLWIPIVVFLIALFPFVRIPRALFLYHYFTPLVLTIIVGLLWLDGVLPKQRKRVVLLSASLITVLAFFWFSPLTYGFPIAQNLQPLLFWFTSWR